MTPTVTSMRPKAGDWLVVPPRSVGDTGRRGLILEILGEREHERYRVRWDEEHESIFSSQRRLPDTTGTRSMRDGRPRLLSTQDAWPSRPPGSVRVVVRATRR